MIFSAVNETHKRRPSRGASQLAPCYQSDFHVVEDRDATLGEVVDRLIGKLFIKDEKTNVVAPGHLLKSIDKTIAENPDDKVDLKGVIKSTILSDPVVAASAAAFAALTPNITKKVMEVLR